MNTVRLALCLTPLLLTGCVVGNSAKLQVTRNITLGQELTDLKTALDDGSITLSEYQALRAKVFESADHVLGSTGWTAELFTDHDHDHDDHDGDGHDSEEHGDHDHDGDDH